MHRPLLRSILTLTLLTPLILSLPQQPLHDQKPLNIQHLNHLDLTTNGQIKTYGDWDIDDLAVGARNEEGNYEGWEVWRFDLSGQREEDRGGFLRVVQVSARCKAQAIWTCVYEI